MNYCKIKISEISYIILKVSFEKLEDLEMISQHFHLHKRLELNRNLPLWTELATPVSPSPYHS